jgi:glucan phosphoethanolaminetransferase (alkaline phosphatase superfamily)
MGEHIIIANVTAVFFIVVCYILDWRIEIGVTASSVSAICAHSLAFSFFIQAQFGL